jgi:hypothetical protein
MSKHGPRPFGDPRGEQQEKMRIDKDGTLRDPGEANATNGLVIGDRHRHPLLRLKRRLARI